MLVLARKQGQSVIINEQITVTVVDIRRDGTVRLGFEAPRDVSIHRLEVQQEIDRERREAEERRRRGETPGC